MNKKITPIKFCIPFLLIFSYGCKGQQETVELSVNVSNYKILTAQKVNDSTNLKIYQFENKHLISLIRNQKIIDTIEVITNQSNTAFSSICEYENKKTFAIVYDECIEDKYEVAQAFNIDEKYDELVKLANRGVVCLSEIPCDSNEDFTEDRRGEMIPIESRTNWRLNCDESENLYFDEDMISQLTIKNLFSLSITVKKIESNIYEVYFMDFSPIIPLTDEIRNVDVEKTQPIAKIELKSNNDIEFYWLGFVDKMTRKREFIVNPFDKMNNPVVLRK